MIAYNPGMEFPVRIEGDVALIAPQGRVTIGESAEAFARAVEAAFDGGARHILVDCTKIPYADSSGIGELLAAMRRARASEGRVALFGPRGKIHEVLEITQLARYFLFGGTEEEARRLLTVG